MNKTRRAAIAAAMKPVSAVDLGMAQTLTDAKDELETLRDEEQESYDNLPESLQDGDRGQAMQTAIEALDTAIEALDTAITAFEEAESAVQDAIAASEEAAA